MKLFLIIFFLISCAEATDPYWHKLLHYRKDFFGKFVSEVDSPDFFVSPDGKRSPENELKSSISVLNSLRGQEFVCRFPLRYRWLKKNVKNDWNFTSKPCDIYNAFVGKLDAKNLSLVFSSFYVNNPGSTFGHTFIHVSRNQKFRTNELLDYAINYAAQESKDNIFLYMIKGLTGYYPGKFSVIPYYYKIREYNDHEFRDIWDYDLNLSQEQIDRVIDHVWEMATAHFDYYYFTENCSYHILGLLNVAYDDVDILNGLPSFYVLPIDTVKEMKKLGLVKERKVRVSAYGRLLKETEDFSHHELRMVKASAENPKVITQNLTTDIDLSAKFLDATIAAFDYLNAEAVLTNQKKATDQRQELLILRAENPIISSDLKFDEKKMDAPDDSHGSSRFGLGAGYKNRDGHYETMEWRAAQHELLDPSQGQLKYSQVIMFDTRLRFQQTEYDRNRLVLDRFRFADLKKYQAPDFWNKSISWDLAAGLDQRRECLSRDCLNPNVTFGVGSSSKFNDDTVMTLLLGGSYLYDRIYENDSLLSLGPKLNLLLLKENFSFGLDINYFLPTELFDGWLKRRMTYDFDFRYFHDRNISFFVKSSHLDQDVRPVHESQIGVYFYH